MWTDARLRQLIECVRDPFGPRPAVAPEDLPALTALAVRHGVAGCLWASLRTAGLAGDPEATAARVAYGAAVGRHLRTLSDLELASRALADLAPLVVKGPVLAEVVYPRSDLRGYADLDLLVRPADFGPALAALESAGCTVYDRNWRLLRDRGLGAVRLHTPSDGVLDLHWHLFYERRVRAAVPVPLDSVRGRARGVDVGGVPVLTLDPLDTVVHLAVHAALDGGDRLVWLNDLRYAVARLTAVEWAGLAERADSWGARPAVALMLRRVRSVLGAAVDVPHVGPVWTAVGRAAELGPVLGAGRPAPARAVARSSRSDGAASGRELTRRALASLRVRDRDRFDPADPASAAHPAGDRAAYLAALPSR